MNKMFQSCQFILSISHSYILHPFLLYLLYAQKILLIEIFSYSQSFCKTIAIEPIALYDN